MDFFVWQRTIVDEAGNVLPSASVSVTDVVSGALAQLYSDEGVSAIGNPITADSDGFVQFYVRSGKYDVAASLDGNSREWNDEAIGAPYKRTAAEVSASVTPTNSQHPPGDFRRYGAAGDGSTDDGAAVRGAILQSLESGGAIPFGQPGATYLCTTWTAIDTTATFRLRGNGCTIEGPSTYADFCRPGGSVDVENVKFDHWLSMFERASGESGSIDGFRIRFCEFTDFTSIPVNIERPIQNYWITDNLFHDGTCGDALRIGHNSQADQAGWFNGHILRNTFRDIEIDTSTEGGAILVYGSDTEIVGNDIDGINNAGGAGREAWGIYTKVINGTITHNKVRNITSASGSAWGINVKGEVRTVTTTPQGFGSKVSHNYVHTVTGGANGGYCIRLQTDSVICTNNQCEETGSAGTGISLDYSEPAITGISSTVISHNLIRFSSAGTTVALRISTGLSYVRVSNNIVVNPSIGIRASTVTSSETDWEFVDNTLEVDSQGILIRRDEDLDGILIARNTIRGSTPPATGIRFETGSGLLSRVRVHDNDLKAATTQLSGTLPGDIEIRHLYNLQTTDAGPTTMVTLNLSDESSYFINSKAIAVLNDGAEANGYHKDLTVKVDGGTASVVGAIQEASTSQETTAAWDLVLDATSQTARIRLTGEAAHTINWKVWLHVLGVTAA